MLRKTLTVTAFATFAATSFAAAQDHGMTHSMMHGEHMMDGEHHTDGDHVEDGDHMRPGDHMMDEATSATEPGQSAFAAIQEIVGILSADPQTDWSKVDIEGLRQHLIDMDNVTMRAQVERRATNGGTTFVATSPDPEVAASIQRMVLAHAATMNGVQGWTLSAETVPNGAALTAAGDPEKVLALGFIGIMASGAHHQAHHLALAKGAMPH